MGPVEEGTGLEKTLRGFGLRDWIHEVNPSPCSEQALRKVVTPHYLPTRLRRKVGIS